MLGHIKKEWQIKTAHEKGFKFQALPQTDACSCFVSKPKSDKVLQQTKYKQTTIFLLRKNKFKSISEPNFTKSERKVRFENDSPEEPKNLPSSKKFFKGDGVRKAPLAYC